MIYFILGLIVGLIIRKVQTATPQELRDFRERIPVIRQGTQFVESVSGKEKFDNAKNISELIDK